MKIKDDLLNPVMLSAYFILAAVNVLFCTNPYRNAEALGAVSCAADGIRYSNWELCRVVCVIIAGTAYILVRRESFNVMYILLEGGRKKLWKKDAFQTFVFSVLFSGVSVVTAAVVSLALYGKVMNWADADSFAQCYTRVSLDNKNVAAELLLCWFISCMQTCFALLVILTAYYLLDNYLWGLIAVIAAGFNDMQVWSFKLYFARFAVPREGWLFLDFGDMKKIMLLPVINIVVFCIGLLLAERKEYYNAEIDKT
jgi:hypothetical protein